MPNRDTFRIEVTVRDDYEDDWTTLATYDEHLSPGQREPATIASLLRITALKAAPEDGDARSVEAILTALDQARAKVVAPDAWGPATRDVLLQQLWDLAGALGLEWYGYRPASDREEG